MSSAISDFKFEGEDGQAQKITKVVDVTTHMVQYFDHDGKQQARLVARDSQTGAAFIISSQIQGKNVVVPSTKWFQKGLDELIKGDDADTGVESI